MHYSREANKGYHAGVLLGPFFTSLDDLAWTSIFPILEPKILAWTLFWGFTHFFVEFLGIYALFCQIFGDLRTFLSNFVATDVDALLLEFRFVWDLRTFLLIFWGFTHFLVEFCRDRRLRTLVKILSWRLSSNPILGRNLSSTPGTMPWITIINWFNNNAYHNLTRRIFSIWCFIGKIICKPNFSNQVHVF